MGSSSEMVVKSFSKARTLLESLDGIQFSQLSRADECCGFGGTFAVSEEAVSCMMGQDRIHDHEQAGTEVLTAADMSCLMHLDAGFAATENVCASCTLPRSWPVGQCKRFGLPGYQSSNNRVDYDCPPWIILPSPSSLSPITSVRIGTMVRYGSCVPSATRPAHTLPEWETLREKASQIKAHTLSRLADYLEEFESAMPRG